MFEIIKDIIEPIRDAIDEFHFSDEEEAEIEIKKSELRNKLAEIQYRLTTEFLSLQSDVVEANTKIAIAEQSSDSFISKNWRPICSLCSFIMLSLMGFKIMEFNEFLATIYGSMIGYHGVLRSLVDKKK